MTTNNQAPVLQTKIAIKSFIDMKFGGGKKRKNPETKKFDLDPFPEREVQIVTADLPQETLDFIFAYGLRQYIGDKFASAGDAVDFNNGIDKALENIKSGDFSRAGGGFTGSVYDDMDKLVKAKLRAALKTLLDNAGQKTDAKALTAAVDQLFADKENELTAQCIADAEAEMAKQKELQAKATGVLAMFGLTAKKEGE